MKFAARNFDELSACQLYAILKSRMAVFMPERGIPHIAMEPEV